MISRRLVLFAAGASLLGTHGWSRGQSANALRRVAWVEFAPESLPSPTREAFLAGMRELGWLESKNVEYRFGHASLDMKRLDALLAETLAWKPEVIVTASGATVRAAQRATKTTPIVMAYIANAVGNGFVASLARPGGNITGSTTQAEEVLPKMIELLHELAPKVGRVAILLNESNPSHNEFWSAAQRACAALGLVALRVAANAPAQFSDAAKQMIQQQVQGVAVAADPLFNAERAKLHETLMLTRLPVIYGLRENALAGGLLSFGPNIVTSHRNAARFVDKILRGAKPADLPVEQPTTFDLVVNKKTAKALGLTIPYSIMLRATEVIE